MSDIFVMLRNQDNLALTSIAGVAFVTLLHHDGLFIAEEVVDLIYADSGFDDLPLGEYTVIVRHDYVEPPEVAYDVSIDAVDDVILLKFVYQEPERRFVKVQVAVEKRL